ncbi:hypothetical protein OB905_09580 [Halobacteria archaeon AArc-dxtr1]|nr:hypothetical protein [Halobacteria archaeon AArc-dxtr1]
MDKERLPQWAWLLLGLFVTALVANTIYISVLEPIGLSPDYLVVILISSMSLVVIYLGVWYNEERSAYWERPKAAMFGDVTFVLVGAVTVSALVISIGLDRGLSQLPRELLAMIAGFATAWVLFYWRNPDLYGAGS